MLRLDPPDLSDLFSGQYLITYNHSVYFKNLSQIEKESVRDTLEFNFFKNNKGEIFCSA